MNDTDATTNDAPTTIKITVNASLAQDLQKLEVKLPAETVAQGATVEVDVTALPTTENEDTGNASKFEEKHASGGGENVHKTPATENDADPHQEADSDHAHASNTEGKASNAKDEADTANVNSVESETGKLAQGDQLQVRKDDEASKVAKVDDGEADGQKQAQGVPMETCKEKGATVAKGTLSKEEKEISKMIAKTVSEDVAKQYTQATEIVRGAPDEEALQIASEHLVKALQSAEDKDQAGEAYAELSLTYGQVMLGFVIRRAMGSGVLGSGVKAEGAEEDIGNEEEDVVDEEEEEQITWTQLEIARVTFEKLIESGNERLKRRLAEAHRTLGELLVALDQASQAGAEFGKGSELCDGRDRAECLHKQYLAMRREDKSVAGNALRKCITELEGLGEAKDTDLVAELKDELRGFAAEGEQNGETGGLGGASLGSG
ncbi:unnamed protein product, partial [Agarophyton chilense]